MENKNSIIIKATEINELVKLIKDEICLENINISVRKCRSSHLISLDLEISVLVIVIIGSAKVIATLGKVLEVYFKERKGILELKKSDGTELKVQMPEKDIRKLMTNFYSDENERES